MSVADRCAVRTVTCMQQSSEQQDEAGPEVARQQSRRRTRAWWLGGSFGLIGIAGACAFMAVAYISALAATTPGIEDLQAAQNAKPSVLLSADGKTMQVLRQKQHEPVPLERISP